MNRHKWDHFIFSALEHLGCANGRRQNNTLDTDTLIDTDLRNAM